MWGLPCHLTQTGLYHPLAVLPDLYDCTASSPHLSICVQLVPNNTNACVISTPVVILMGMINQTNPPLTSQDITHAGRKVTILLPQPSKSWDYRLGSMNEQTLHMGTNADGRLVWLMCPTWRLLKVSLILLYSSFSKSLTRGHNNLFQPVPSSRLERHKNYGKAQWTGACPGHVRNLNLFIIWHWVFTFKKSEYEGPKCSWWGVDRQVTRPSANVALSGSLL